VAEIIKTVIDVDINTSGAAAELRNLQKQINAFNLTLNKGQLEQGQASRVFAEGLKNSINTGGFFRAELVKMQTAAGALDSTLRKGQGTLGQFFSASFNKKGGMAAEVFALAAERARTMQTQFIATAKASKGMQEALAVRPLTAFSADAAVSAQRMQILNSMFKQGTTGLINFGKNVQWTGRQLMVGFTIPLTIFGTTAGRVFSDLEKQAVNFKKVYGDIFTTPAQLEENFKAVQGLSKEFTKYGIAAKDTLSLAAQAAAAGRQNTDLTDAVRESTRLATLGQMDQNAALETTISLQSAFKLSGTELADTINFLNMVENQTVVSLQDIAAAIPRVAPVIKGLGGDVKDLTVFLAAMQEGGVSAEQGANALKSGLGSLINPTKTATDVLAGFKINLDSIIQTNRGDIMGTVMAFSQALSTLDDFSKQQALESVFGKFQYARLGALFENISREGSQAQQVISTLGYTQEQLAKSAEKELSTVENAFNVKLTGAIERLKIAIAPLGEIFIKMAIPLVNMVTKIVDAFNRLPEGVKNVAALATVLGGVLLPAATMIFGLFANLIGTFAKFTHSMGMFGVTLLRKGPLAAIKSLTQSANYLSLSEIDAANAARQLGSATELANAALLSQVSSANSADVAIKNLTNSYRVLISEQTRASQVQPFLFGTGQAAGNLGRGSAAASVATTMATRGKSRIKSIGLNKGGSVFTPDYGSTVPGVGNTDKVPAMLTPGEFVVNKESTKNNLGLLHSINAQKLNVGGKVKNGIQYAMSGFKIGNTPGYSAATNSVAAKLAGRSQVAKTVSAKVSNKTEQLKNNFVYLLKPSNNQQLTGVRTMKEFDKRGVPIDILKQDMVSEEGLWMIDALAKGDWKKNAYKSTLENNFAKIAAKYSGKEIRFLDSAGLERVQPLLGKPEYQNVQFVSVKDLQNKELLDNLTPDHLQSLMTEATQVSKKLRTSKSRGTTSVKDTYEGITGMESYTKIQENWRGARRPSGRHGAHMYNMGGKVDGVQKLSKGSLVRDLRSTFRKALVYGAFHRGHKGKAVETGLENIFESMWKKTGFTQTGKQRGSLFSKNAINQRKTMLMERGLDERTANQLASKPLRQAIELAKEKKVAFYATGFGGGTSGILGARYNFLMEDLFQVKRGGGKFFRHEKAKEAAKDIPDYILEGSFPLTPKDAKVTARALEKMGNEKQLKQMIKELDDLSKINEKDYLQLIRKRVEPVHIGAGGKANELDFIFNNLPKNYTAKDILKNIYNIDSPALSGNVKGIFTNLGSSKNKKDIKSSIGNMGRLTTVKDMAAATGLSPRLMVNKGGMIPGVQYAMSGKLIKDSMRAPFGVPAWGPNKSSNVAKGSWGSLMEGITTRRKYDWDKIPIETLKPGMTAGRRTSGTRPLNVEIYDPITKKTIGQYDVDPTNATEKRSLLNTLQVEKSKGFKEAYIRAVGEGFNKGGMIPGVQYANIGKMIGKSMGLNADDALGAFGLLKPTIRSGGKTKIPKNLTMKEIFNHKDFKEGIYLVQPQGGQPYEASLYYFNGKPRLQRHGQYNVGSGIGTRTRQFDPIDVDPNMRASIYNRNEYTGSNVSGPFKASKGSIVPGTGNTDTVPAMLTPGEFVINKESTKQNYHLLNAINNGKMNKYNKGGVASGIQYFAEENTQRVVKPALPRGYNAGRGAASMVGGMLPFMFGNMGPMQSMAASIIGGSVASKATGVAMKLLTGRAANLAGEFKLLGNIITKLGPGLTGTLGIGGAAIALGIALNNMAKKTTQAGSDFVNATYGSTKTMTEFAKSMGRENIQQQLTTKRAEVAGGGAISQQSKQYSTQFLETAGGKGLLENASTVAKTRGVKGRDQAILNQLLRGVVTQSITAEEARAIAIDIGTKLNDQTIGINIGAKLNKLVGPNGENLSDNLLNISAIITPKIDAQEAQKIVNEQWQNTGLLSKFAMIITGRGTDDMLAKTIATQAQQAAQVTTEQLDLLKYELEQGSITYQEFILQKENLTKESVTSTGEALATIIGEFNGDMSKATDAIKAFRAEINKGFELKLSGMNKAEAAKVRKFVNTFETAGAPPQTIQVGKVAGSYNAPKVNQNQADVIRQITDPSILLALSKIEDINVNQKLERMFAIDPTLVATMQDYVTAGGQVADFMSNSIEEMSKYKTELDRLAGVQEKFKTGVDITELLLNPDKLSEFTKQASVAQSALDALSLQKNITKEVAMNVITTYMGENATAKKLLEHYLSTGNKFKDLDLNAIITMSVSNPNIASALAVIEQAKKGANVGIAALVEAYKILGGKTASSIGAGGGGSNDGAKSALQSAKDAARQTKEVIAAQSKLLAAGISLEALDGLSPEAIIELSKQSGKQLRDNIKLFNEQAESIKINKLALEQLAIEDNPVKKALEDSKKAVEGYDNQIQELNKTIEKSNRADELDRRKIEDRNKALDNLSKKEKSINEQYDLRVKALDQVSNANSRAAEKQRQQIDLATALTSGDIAGAAQAAGAMTQTDAQNSIEDTKTALEAQRAAEVSALTESVNGQLLTREQIQAQIDSIEETIYQRNINLRATNDEIYTIQQNINTEKNKQNNLNKILDEQEKVLVEKAKEKLGHAKNITKESREQLNNAIKQAYVQAGGVKKVGSLADYQKSLGLAFGGMVNKYAYGGNVGYKGSREAPPRLKMAMGSIVPGLGNTDRVPALLTPGEFVVKKSVAQANMPLLEGLNGNVFPNISPSDVSLDPSKISSTSVVNNNTPVYTYNVNVNVPNTDATPDQIANIVASKIRKMSAGNIRGSRY